MNKINFLFFCFFLLEAKGAEPDKSVDHEPKKAEEKTEAKADKKEEEKTEVKKEPVKEKKEEKTGPTFLRHQVFPYSFKKSKKKDQAPLLQIVMVLATWSPRSSEVFEDLKRTGVKDVYLLFCHDSEESIQKWNEKQNNHYPWELAPSSFNKEFEPTIPSAWLLNKQKHILDKVDLEKSSRHWDVFLKNFLYWSEF